MRIEMKVLDDASNEIIALSIPDVDAKSITLPGHATPSASVVVDLIKESLER
jgi:hypothetical protein